MDSGDSRLDALREAIRKEVSATSLRDVAGQVGVSHATIAAFLDRRAEPTKRTAARMEKWLDERGQKRQTDQPATRPAMPFMDTTALADLYRRIDAIEASSDPGWLKTLRTDSLAAAVRAEAMRQAELAGLERAAAIRTAEEAAKERAATAGKEVEGATARAAAMRRDAPPVDNGWTQDMLTEELERLLRERAEESRTREVGEEQKKAG